MSREEPVTEPLVMKEALHNYYDRTFEYALGYFNDHWSRIKDQPQLEEAYEIIQKFPETKPELEKIRSLYEQVVALRKTKRKRRVVAYLLSLLMELYLYEYDGMKKSLVFLMNVKFRDYPGLKQCLDLIFQVRVLFSSLEEEVVANFQHLCDIAPEDFQYSRVLWGITQQNPDVRAPLWLEIARIADRKKPVRPNILGFKAFAYIANNNPLEALYTYIVITDWIKENKKGEDTLPVTYYHMAECFFNVDNMPMTINFCNKSLRESIDRNREDNLPEIYYLRAQAFLIQGKTERARKDLQEAMDRDPDYDEPRKLMDRIEEED